MKKLFNEPLLHFMVMGVLIFFIYSVVNDEEISVDGKTVCKGSSKFMKRNTVEGQPEGGAG